MSRLRASLYNHLPFIIILPLLIIVMTWPTFVYVFDTETFWLPSKDKDIFFKLWDVWYGRQILAGKADFFYTDLQFYPQGLSLVYHQFVIPHMIAVGLLQLIMPLSNAYNLCFLLLLFANASATYLLLLLILRDKLICLFGASLVAASPYFRLGSTLPDLTLIATLPLAIYFLQRAIHENRLSFAAVSGLAAGATVFIGMYIFICILLTLGMLGLYFALSRWKERRFWTIIAILLCALGAASMIRIGPMIADRESLNVALDKDTGFDASNDLLGYVVLSHNPITFPFVKDLSDMPASDTLDREYLGLLPLILIIAGLASRSHRRPMLPWLVMLAVFLLLGLGDTLTFNRQNYPDIVLPLRALDQLFPALFRPFWNARHFQIGAVLPLAVLSCYGLCAVAKRAPPGRALWVVMALVALVAVDYFAPREGSVIAKGQTKFIKWLATEEQAPIRLINLPMGRATSKYYSFLQSVGGYPHVHGAANRTLRESYSYIDANPVLRAWRNYKSFFCFPSSAKTFNDALEQLITDGFTHVVLHEPLKFSKVVPLLFPHTLPAYKDDFAYVYRLPDMRDICQHTAMLSSHVFPQLDGLLPPSTVRAGDEASVLSIHPAADAVGGLEEFYRLIQETSPVLRLLTVDDIAPPPSGSGEAKANWSARWLTTAS